jgi:hypothetical protein
VNHDLLRILDERGGLNLTGSDKKILDFFVEYLDHSSLFLLRVEGGGDPAFIFTNDAQHFTFRMSDIRKYYADMKSGIAMKWEEIPFEYITKK